jgi:hypothetical protein
MNDVDCISRFQSVIDCHVASIAFLSGAWRLIWEYNQFSSLQKGHMQGWNALLMTSRFEELLKLLLHFRISVDGQLQLSPDINIQLELSLMHLHISLDEVLLFAGIEGPEEARQVLTSLREWVHDSTARQAMWHAGQVLRTARKFPKASLSLFPALAVYHASIAFWTYGLLQKDVISPDTMPLSRNEPIVRLDATDSMDMQRFIQLGHGSPTIGGFPDGVDGSVSSQTLLTEPSNVMKAMIEALKSNFRSVGRPLLVENLIQLMTELQSAANGAS